MMIGRQCRASSKFEVVSDSISMPHAPTRHSNFGTGLFGKDITSLPCRPDTASFYSEGTRRPGLPTLEAPLSHITSTFSYRAFKRTEVRLSDGCAILAHASHKRGLRRSLSTVSSEVSQISKAKVAMSWRRAKRRSPWSPGFLDSCCHLNW